MSKSFLLSRHGARIYFPNGIYLSIHNGPQSSCDGAMATMSEVIRYETCNNGVTNLVRSTSTVELWIAGTYRDEFGKEREEIVFFSYDEKRPRYNEAYGKEPAPFLPHVTSTELATIMGLAAAAADFNDLWDLLIPSFGATADNIEDNSND